jgi:hypothetical protein
MARRGNGVYARVKAATVPLGVGLCVLASLFAVTPRASGATTDCDGFATQARAQASFLANGGPASDAYGLDPDGNGIACDTNPAPYRGVLSIGYAGEAFTGALVPASPGCIEGRSVSVFKLRKQKPPRRIGSAALDEHGNYSVPSKDSNGRFVAKIPGSGPCAAEASASFTVGRRRLEIAPAAGLLFTEVDQVRSVDATFVDDATGARTPASAVWFRSTNADNFSVTRSGQVTARAKNGSSQIIASAEGITSAPLLAVVVGLNPETITLTDDQILSGPDAIDTDGADPFDDRFTAVLTDEPQVGALYVSVGDKGLVGRVESFQKTASGYEVMFVQVPLDDAVPELTIDESFDLGMAPISLSDAAGDFNVTRSGTTLTFEEKSPSAAPGAMRVAAADEEPSGPCKASGGLSSPVKFTPIKAKININPNVEFSEVEGRFAGMRITADPVIEIEHGVTIQSAFNFSIKCEFDLYEYRKPVPGFLGFILGFQVPIGFTFTVGGKMTLAGLTIKKVTTLKAHAALGVACPGGTNCGLVQDLSAEKPVSKVEVSSQNAFDGPRLEPELSAKVGIAAQFGAHEPKSLRLTLVEAEYGPKLSGQFGTVVDQLNDDTFSSLYKLNMEGALTPGPQLAKLAEKLSIGEIEAPSVDFPEVPLAHSPTGTMDVDGSYRKANLKLHLENTKFLGLYNVDRVILVKRNYGETGEPEVVEERVAQPGQTEFGFTYVSRGGTMNFYALVITKILRDDDFKLEVAKGAFFSCGPETGTRC